MGHQNGNINTCRLVFLLVSSLFALSSPLVEGRRRLQAIKGPHIEYAMVTTLSSPKTRLYGVKAWISVWKPAVSREADFSASMVRVTVAEGAYMAAGWTVYPQRYRDFRSRFFVYWTADGGGKTGCYDLDCKGFVLIDKSFSLGSLIVPVSTLGSAKQSYINLLIFQDRSTGHWVLSVGGTSIGYWPASLFKSLSLGAKTVAWGGQIYDSVGSGKHTATDMGNGLFPSDGTKASIVRSLQYVDSSNTLRAPDRNMLGLFVTNPLCYNAQLLPVTNTEDGVTFLFGGSGLNPRCP